VSVGGNGGGERGEPYLIRRPGHHSLTRLNSRTHESVGTIGTAKRQLSFLERLSLRLDIRDRTAVLLQHRGCRYDDPVDWPAGAHGNPHVRPDLETAVYIGDLVNDRYSPRERVDHRTLADQPSSRSWHTVSGHAERGGRRAADPGCIVRGNVDLEPDGGGVH